MADGHILIDTKIDTKGVIDGTDKVIAAARRMAKQVDGLSTSVRTSLSRQADAIQKASRQYVEQGEKIEELKQKLEELKNQQIPTDEYKKNQEEIQKTEEALNKLIEKQIRFTETGGKTDSRAFEQMEYDIENARNKLEELRATKEQMESSGTAFTPGADTQQSADLEDKIAAATRRHEDAARSLTTAYEALEGKVEEYGQKMAKAGEETEKAKKSTNKLGEAAKNSANTLGSSVKTLLKYSLGIRSLYALVGKLPTIYRSKDFLSYM